MPKYAELPAFREQNFITEADGDMLHREARALAIRRIEESARTEADFENVLYWWDKLDANGNGKKETMRQDAPLFLWNGAQMNCTFPTALPMT